MVTRPRTTQPIYSFLALLAFLGCMLALYLTGNDGRAGLFLALGVSTVPSLVAALSAERAARDIRNGTVVAKVKQGAHEAMAEAGVMTRTGPVATAQLEALRVLVADVHRQQQENATKLDTIVGQTE